MNVQKQNYLQIVGRITFAAVFSLSASLALADGLKSPDEVTIEVIGNKPKTAKAPSTATDKPLPPPSANTDKKSNTTTPSTDDVYPTNP